jgi:hypothetical protein
MVVLRVDVSRGEVGNGGLFVLVGYVSVFLFLEENYIETNYFGWIYIVILTIHLSFTGVE